MRVFRSRALANLQSAAFGGTRVCQDSCRPCGRTSENAPPKTASLIQQCDWYHEVTFD